MRTIHAASHDALETMLENALERVAVVVIELEDGEIAIAHMIAEDLELDLRAAIAKAKTTQLKEAA
jgi:hypothetical protein